MTGRIRIRKTRFTALLLLPLLAALPVKAGSAAAGADDEVLTISSDVLGEERVIKVHLPEGYEGSGKRYTVIYAFDAEMEERWRRSCRELDSLAVKDGVEEAVMVGVCNTVRSRDMIPAKLQVRRETGGSDAFLRFIAEELIPRVEREYRVSERRILFGNSNSGLFAVYALLVRPCLFQGAIAGSPMIGHCGAFMDEVLEDISDTGAFEGKSLFMIYGGEGDYAACTDFVPAYREKLRTKLPGGFHTSLVLLAGEGHVPRSTFVRGLRYICSEEG